MTDPSSAVEFTDVSRHFDEVRAVERVSFRIPDGEPNAGQVELPGPGVLVDSDPDDLAAALESRFDAAITPGDVVATVRHAITHHRITLHAHAATARRSGRLKWFRLGDETPWTTPSRKVFRGARGLEA